jgi:O-antigen/teichoic acid export membrane protein
MSPVAVSAFFISQRVIGIAGNFLMGISGSTWAAMGELYNSGEHEKFEDLFIRISKFIAVTSAIVAIPLVLMSQSFVTLWVGESLFVSNFFILVAVLNLLVQSVLTFWGWCFTVTHKVHKLIKLQIVSTIVNIIASIYFTYKYQHVGPILGTLFSYIFIFMWWMIWHLRDEFNFHVKRLILTFVPSLVYVLVLSALGMKYIEYFSSQTWLQFILTSMVVGILNCAICVLGLFNRSEREFFINRVLRLVKK